MNPKMKEIIEWLYCILIAVVLALLVRFYIGTPTVVEQPSMNDTFQAGQRLILNRWVRTVKGEYKRGDIITFEAPSNPTPNAFEIDFVNPIAIYEKKPKSKFAYYVLEIGKVSYIKRVIGIEGDHIKIEDGKVFLNDKELQEDYVKKGATTESNLFTELVVPKDCVFVMGDNREHSTDSRSFGCIPISKIESKVWIRFWPLNLFGKVE